MKKFRAKHRDGQPDPGPVFSALPPSESNWLRDLQPMFNLGAKSHFTNDLSLNLNPCITTGASLFTDNSTRCGKSVFSSEFSSSTLQSSVGTAPSARKRVIRDSDYGQRLEILEITEDFRDDVSQNPQDLIAYRLHTLWQDMSYVVSQHRTSIINLSTAAINVVHRLKDFVAFLEGLTTAQPWSFSAYNNDDVRRILKMFLHLYDNLLQDDAFMKLKLMLCKAFNDFNASLKSFSRAFSGPDPGTILKPQNFAIGINNGQKLAHQDAITRIIAKIAGSDVGLNEQNGSFIAPIARGISKDMNVLCLYFGYSTLTDNHQRIVNSIQELYEDIHVIVAKNRIGVASTATASSGVQHKFQPDTSSYVKKFKLPFRVPTDPKRPPMSLSISVESSARVSGTMGGFIYPKIDLAKQPHLSSYANLKFAISCGHVCLDKHEDSAEYPYISSPLSVVIGLYKNALLREYQKVSSACGGDLESQAAYGSIYKQLDEMFPKKEVKVYDPKTRKELIEVKNLPKHRFGQIIWGERKHIDDSTKDGRAMVDKRLSDLAIIKVNKILQCDQNYLGDDVPFSEYDPSLKFENLYVREVVSLKRNAQELPFECVTEIDSVVSLPSHKNVDRTTDGLPVFKYGSTTKFTKGNLNGIKLVYWLDGAVHSSEFVVSSVENTTSFAAGGDSGSWILSKLEDVRGVPGTKGLGVVGMLHSNDGENREFGLFTPMMEILDRLEQVTNIQWGVIGVQEKSEESMAKTSDFSDSGSVYESGVEEQVSDID
ncbi:peptidase S64 [Metschnikowia bicuspidata]|uniref:Peptidase S64 n=1 Tax=Metschnikowia bicuspidata TaxID=27322 RepID=A0A4P9ZJ36_9ASCO|nr:peptidase S64 [Metschnikowia bicuspidata]